MTVTHAQQMRERVTFQRRLDNGYPGDYTGWTDQFTLAARLKPRLTGNESIDAARMNSLQPYVLTVRQDVRTRAITPDWRAYDARKGIGANGEPVRLFEIRSLADVGENGQYVDFLVQEGAPG